MIRLEGVCLPLPGFELKNINIQIKKGTHLFLVGPSGSGKTLLLETIAGLHPQVSGKVVINGRDMTGIPPESRGIGLLYQDYALFPHLNVRENVEFSLRARGLAEGERRERSVPLLQKFGLSSFSDRYPGTLSGGERQRVALARAIAAGQEILLLDEPFAAIDPELRSRVFEEVADIIQSNNLTVIQVSHSRDEAYALADSVAVMMNGTIVQAGTREEVFSHPKTPGIARFLGYENLLHCMPQKTAEATLFLTAGNCVFRSQGTIEMGSLYTACIRASDIRISAEHPRTDGNLCRTCGIITGIIEEEHGVKVVLDCGVPIVARLSWNEQANLRLYRGQSVTISIPPECIHVIQYSPDDTPFTTDNRERTINNGYGVV